MTNKKYSQTVQEEAMKVAKATQKPGQTKEQTKLIAQGIEKGIAEYKKQQKKKSREQDKAKKKALKAKVESVACDNNLTAEANGSVSWLPWLLLGLSWIGFIAYLAI